MSTPCTSKTALGRMSGEKECTSLDATNQQEGVEVRCVQCKLLFWSSAQLEKHAAVHKIRKTKKCIHCEKTFSRGARLKLHIRSCDKNPEKKKKTKPMVQVGRGASGAFDFVESALEGLMQVWRYVFSSQEQDDIYTSIDSALMKEGQDLVVEAEGLFKWYFVLKMEFYKMTNPTIVTNPPAFFRSEPIASYRKYDKNVWEIIKGQLLNQIENYEKNGSGWVAYRLLSLDVTFARMANPLQPRRDDSDTDED